MAAEKKKVVKSTAAGEARTKGSAWKPTDEAKKKAVTFRWIAAALWALAIGGEAYAIFGVLAKAPVNTTLLIILIVAIGALAFGGNLLWRKSNQLDPASEKNKLRFWVQNQLGAIITVIAFLPLIILIFFNKDMTGKQKAIVGGIGILVFLPVLYSGAELNSNSAEQMDAEYGYIQALTGDNHVYWTKAGGVYHLCSAADYVNKQSRDNTIYEGTIEQANAEGKRAPADQTIKTESKQCGFEYFSLDEYKATLLQDNAPDDATDSATDDAVEETESEG